MGSAKRLAVLSGPACAGKGPLQEALKRFHPDLVANRPVLCHSRRPRYATGEIHGEHYYFLPPALIAAFQNNLNFAAAMVRSDWQAIDLLQVEDMLSDHSINLVFAEVFHTFGDVLRKRLSGRPIGFTSIFLLPVPVNTPPTDTINTMKEKLILRGTDKEPKLTERAESAPIEMTSAQYYTHRLLNPATEDNIQEWGEFGTQGGKSGSRPIRTLNDLGPDAKWLVETAIEILEDKVPPCPEDYPHMKR